jgi:hypothetical protein
MDGMCECTGTDGRETGTFYGTVNRHSTHESQQLGIVGPLHSPTHNKSHLVCTWSPLHSPLAGHRSKPGPTSHNTSGDSSHKERT